MDKIKQYYESTRISNSMLSRVENPRLFKIARVDERDTEFFRIGGALDCLLTDPENWEERFIILDVERPTGKMMDFVKALPPGLTERSPLEDFAAAREAAAYKYPLKWCVDNFWKTKEAVSYYRHNDIPKDKTVLSSTEYEGVKRASESLLNSDYTSHFFRPRHIQYEVMHQVPIYFEYMGVECKALLDGVLIDHEGKTVQPFDLKTTGKSVYQFPLSFMQFGYYRQAAFYDYAMRSEYSPVNDLLNNGYKMLDFVFIVVESSKDSWNPPVVYVTTAKDRYHGLEGGTVGGRYYKGINKLMSEYIYYKENDLWDIPKDLLDSHGNLELNVFD